MNDELTNIDQVIAGIKSIKIKDIYNLYKKNKSQIVGQDTFYILDKDKEHYCYMTVYFYFEENNLDINKHFKDKFRPLVDKPDYNLRLKLIDKYTYGYSNESTDKILDYSFKKIDNVDKFSHEEIVKETMLNSNKFKAFIAKNAFILCASHLFYDGMTINNFRYVFEDNPEPIKLPYYKYIPYINEIKCLNSMNNLAEIYEYRRALSYDYDRDKVKPKDTIYTSFSVDIIKNLKKELKNNHKIKTSFSIVFTAIHLLSLFYSTNKNHFIVGTIVAFENPTRFNNFSIITVKINRPENWEKLDKNNCQKLFFTIIKQLNSEIIKRKDLVTTIYSLTNIYNLTIKAAKFVDLLISSVPMCVKTKFTIDGNNCKNTRMNMYYSGTPVYIFSLSNYKMTNDTINIRTDDVDIAKIKHFNDNIDKWLS